MFTELASILEIYMSRVCVVTQNVTLDNFDCVICLSKITGPTVGFDWCKKCYVRDTQRSDHHAENTKSELI